MNVHVPFTFVFAVYVNVYIFPFVASLTVALLNVNNAVAYVTAPLVRLAVLIALHVLIHVNATLPVCPHFISTFVGCVVIVQLGGVISTLIEFVSLVTAFVFHAASATFHAANLNVVVPSAFAVYVNV